MAKTVKYRGLRYTASTDDASDKTLADAIAEANQAITAMETAWKSTKAAYSKADHSVFSSSQMSSFSRTFRRTLAAMQDTHDGLRIVANKLTKNSMRVLPGGKVLDVVKDKE